MNNGHQPTITGTLTPARPAYPAAPCSGHAPQQAEAAGQPAGLTEVFLVHYFAPRRGDRRAAEVAEQPGRLIAIDHRKPPDVMARHLGHGFLEHLVG